MNKILALIGFFIISTNCFCQNHLDFISKKNDKKLTFNIGDRIGYKKKGFTANRIGILQEIKDSVIIVNGKTIKIEDLKFIGHRKKGTGIISFATGFVSGFTLVYLILPKKNSTAQKVTGLSISIPLLTIGEIVSWKNRMHKVKDKYRFEVSDVQMVKSVP